MKKSEPQRHTITMMLVGIPNVGKSSLANSLHQIGRISATGIEYHNSWVRDLHCGWRFAFLGAIYILRITYAYSYKLMIWLTSFLYNNVKPA